MMIITSAYIINLAHRTDRLKSITEQCEKNDLTMNIVTAVNGHDAFPDEPKRKRGFLGCYISHWNTLKILQDTEGDYFLIAEDDCIFEDGFRNKLREYYEQLPDNWDMLYLGGSINTPGSFEEFSVNLCRARNVYCTHAYIIRKESIPGLIEHVESRKWKIDILYAEYQKTHNCFITVPELAWQQAGFSDVENRMTDNVHLRRSRNF